MQTLYLYVEYMGIVNRNAVMSLYEVGKLCFLCLLDVHEAVKYLVIIGILCKLFQLVEVIYPTVTAQQFCDK